MGNPPSTLSVSGSFPFSRCQASKVCSLDKLPVHGDPVCMLLPPAVRSISKNLHLPNSFYILCIWCFFSFSDVKYEWDYGTLFRIWFASVSPMSSRFIYIVPHCCTLQHIVANGRSFYCIKAEQLHCAYLYMWTNAHVTHIFMWLYTKNIFIYWYFFVSLIGIRSFALSLAKK